ncbi:MAG: dTMP kinase, partial [Candidatus Nealsonbacteria bacterium CG_4_9_14_3_um_filter_37_29]
MITNPYPGKFIVFEGLDGSGTTTQANLLFKYLKKQGKKVYLTGEPTRSLIGGLIEGQISGDWKSTPECLQLLFTADRAHHLEKGIIPLLKKGITVICIRYILSTLAYGNLDIKDEKWLMTINKKFIWPDITFLLKVSPKICIQRIKKERFHKELFEKEEKLKGVYKNYLK